MVLSKVCDALVYHLDNIFIGKLVFRWELIVLLLLQICFIFFCYEREFMKSLSRENQADNITEAFNFTFRYLNDLSNIGNIYFDQMMDCIYPTEPQLNKANSSDTEAPFFVFESMYI